MSGHHSRDLLFEVQPLRRRDSQVYLFYRARAPGDGSVP